MAKKIKYLSIGHCCHDKVEDGYILGGTASYASMLSSVLGAESILLTSYGDDFLFEQELKNRNISIHNVLSEKTTIFQNKYSGGSRTQTILARAKLLVSRDFTKLKEQADIIHLSPIADEIDFDLLTDINEHSITIATPQGWLRKWDGEGKISYKEIDWSLLKDMDFVIISEEDVEDLENNLGEILSNIKSLIVTKGEGGSVVYSNKIEAHFPAYPSKIVDATGAGDTFATGFITRYAKTRELVDSMIYANCLASICIEHEGTQFFDKLTELDQRMDFYKTNLLNLNASAPIRVK